MNRTIETEDLKRSQELFVKATISIPRIQYQLVGEKIDPITPYSSEFEFVGDKLPSENIRLYGGEELNHFLEMDMPDLLDSGYSIYRGTFKFCSFLDIGKFSLMMYSYSRTKGVVSFSMPLDQRVMNLIDPEEKIPKWWENLEKEFKVV